ncbi:MAG: phosphoglycerate dehydrogenase [Burkholderiales bacterium]|nr:phosphoglycerate dehydrogenase [Burkholderiales bacterium]
MKRKVLVSAPYLIPALERFLPEFAAAGIDVATVEVQERLSEAELLPRVGDIDGLICGDDAVTARVLDAAPRLKVIAKWGTGVDSIDRAAARARGVLVCNTPDAFSVPVADTTLGYVLCFARGLLAMSDSMRTGAWRKTPGFALHERTLGIVGVGNIGAAVARRARAFGMRILGTDPVPPRPALVAETAMAVTGLEALLAQSDFVTLHCDLNPTSLHLLDEAALARMKPSAVLINTSRGPVVDENALVAALERGGIAGAALDVFENEPLPAGSPLRRMANVLLAPHNANASPAAWERVHRNPIDCVLRVLQGEKAAARPAAPGSA